MLNSCNSYYFQGIQLDFFILISQVLLMIGLFFLGIFLKNYFPKYLEEKAKNIATKEDITDITHQIESVKINYAQTLEKAKFEYQTQSVLHQAFQSKCLESLIALNDLLVEIHLYCWKNLAERSPNEHYAWSNVDDLDGTKGFHYYRVTIDKTTMMYSLYLTQSARNALYELSNQIGLLSSMELALLNSDSELESSAISGYEAGINSVEECRKVLIDELGIAT